MERKDKKERNCLQDKCLVFGLKKKTDKDRKGTKTKENTTYSYILFCQNQRDGILKERKTRYHLQMVLLPHLFINEALPKKIIKIKKETRKTLF